MPPELTLVFPWLFFEYLKQFKEWKIPDKKKLMCHIKHALIELYQGEGHLPAGEPLDSCILIKFSTQINCLLTKLSQIVGPQALEQFYC